jgi:hypothetical protein
MAGGVEDGDGEVGFAEVVDAFVGEFAPGGVGFAAGIGGGLGGEEREEENEE